MSISNILKKLNSRDTKLIPHFSKKTKFIILFALATLTVVFTNISLAESTIKEKQDAMAKGNNQESWMNEALGSNLISFQSMIGGTIPNSILTGQTLPGGYPATTSYRPGGLLGTTNQLISYTFNSPASGVEYIAQVKNEFLGKPAYAATTGFQSLNKLLPLWKILRNTVYSISAIFFVIIGIMIMLRVKISPQAVINVQNSIPKIITTLVLVTFSYAIAGLCIDLMNFLLAFSLALLFNGTGKGFSGNLFNLSWSNWSLENLINLIRQAAGDNPFNYANLNGSNLWTVYSLVNRMAPSIAIMGLGSVLGTIVGGFIGSLPGALLGLAIGALLIVLILEIILAINVIRFFFGLVKCYITIILKIITGPLEIALGAMPNSKMGFSSWIKDVVANLAVFPISLLFLVVVNIIVDYTSTGGLWYPNMISDGGVTAFFLPTMVGVGAILLLPKLPTMIPEFIFQIKPSPWGKAIGDSFAATSKSTQKWGDRAYETGKNTWLQANETGGDSGKLKGIRQNFYNYQKAKKKWGK